MEVHQLKYFIAVSEAKSFSRAAQKCFVSQPALSQQVHKLEDEIGHALFDRLGHQVVLTEAGEIFLGHAKSILGKILDSKQRIKDELSSEGGKLSIGMTPTITPFVFAKTMIRFSKKFPKAKLIVHENTSDKLIEMLHSGELDITYLDLPTSKKPKKIDTEIVVKEPLVLAIGHEHMVGGSNEADTIKNYQTTPYVALSDIHCLSATIQSFCHDHTFSPEIACHTAQLSTVQSLVAHGLGISLVPKIAASTDTSGALKYLSVMEKPERTIIAANRQGRVLTKSSLQFTKILKEECLRLIKKPLGENCDT